VSAPAPRPPASPRKRLLVGVLAFAAGVVLHAVALFGPLHGHVREAARDLSDTIASADKGDPVLVKSLLDEKFRAIERAQTWRSIALGLGDLLCLGGFFVAVRRA
jgi:hypothetical protein